MAGGPIEPYSIVPRSGAAGKAWVGVYKSASTTGVQGERGIRVIESLGADAIVDLFYHLPDTLPTGQAFLRVIARAPAATGNAKWNVAWVVAGSGDDPGAMSLNGEGTQTTTWASGESDEYKEIDIDLDAVALTGGGKRLCVRVTYETSSWTLAQKSGWWLPLYWG
jgi:hypothetical protein